VQGHQGDRPRTLVELVDVADEATVCSRKISRRRRLSSSSKFSSPMTEPSLDDSNSAGHRLQLPEVLHPAQRLDRPLRLEGGGVPGVVEDRLHGLATPPDGPFGQSTFMTPRNSWRLRTGPGVQLVDLLGPFAPPHRT
jgi:hypothetical protein